MNFRPIVLIAFVLCSISLQAAEEKKEQPTVTQEGWMKKIVRTVWPFGKKAQGETAAPVPKGSQSGKSWKQLVPTISIDPMPLKLSDVRTMKVTLQLANHGKKLAQLEFPTTQRIEVLVTDSAGQRIEQWSEDQAFQNEPTLVAINPNERLEYVATVATRDLKAGQSYTVEGFFPNFEQLRASKKITPLP